MSDGATASTAATDTTAATTTSGGSTTVAATATSATTTATTTAAPATTGYEWLGKDVPELDLGYVQNKGWKAPADILNAYRGAEKFISAPVDQRLVMPGEKATPEEVKAFWGKLGTPADAKDYKIPVPAGDTGEFAKTAAQWFHGANLTAKQAETVAAQWNEHMTNLAATQATQKAEAFQKDAAALKAEWGAAHDKNVFIAKEVSTKLGLDGATIDKISDAIGHRSLMNLLAKIGAGLGEDSFTAGRGDNSFGDALTPAAAKAQIEALKNDKQFTQDYLNGKADARAKMAELHKYAYPEQA